MLFYTLCVPLNRLLRVDQASSAICFLEVDRQSLESAGGCFHEQTSKRHLLREFERTQLVKRKTCWLVMVRNGTVPYGSHWVPPRDEGNHLNVNRMTGSNEVNVLLNNKETLI